MYFLLRSMWDCSSFFFVPIQMYWLVLTFVLFFTPYSLLLLPCQCIFTWELFPSLDWNTITFDSRSLVISALCWQFQIITRDTQINSVTWEGKKENADRIFVCRYLKHILAFKQIKNELKRRKRCFLVVSSLVALRSSTATRSGCSSSSRSARGWASTRRCKSSTTLATSC